MLQFAAKEANPNSDPRRPANNISYEITKPVAEKRRARSIWQRTQASDSRIKYNRISNKSKSKLQKMRKESYEKYVSNLKRQNNSIWKPTKNKKPKTASPPIRKYSTPPGPWAKSDKEEAELFAEYLSEVFSPYNNDQDQEEEQDLATPIQSQERLNALTLKEIKDEIKMLNKKKAPGLDLITARMLKELPKVELVNLMYEYIFSAIVRLEYWPKSLKIAQIIMIPKPGKNPKDVAS